MKPRSIGRQIRQKVTDILKSCQKSKIVFLHPNKKTKTMEEIKYLKSTTSKCLRNKALLSKPGIGKLELEPPGQIQSWPSV